MERNLEGQGALVTGATSGIGRACAHAFGAAGARVVVNYRSNAEEGEAVVEEVMTLGWRGLWAAFRATRRVGRLLPSRRSVLDPRQ